MEHQAEFDFSGSIIESLPRSKGAGFNVCLAFSCTQENIPPPPPLNHSFGNEEMFVLISVLRQVLAMQIPLEVRLDLVLDVCEVCVDRKIITTAVSDRLGTARLCLDFVHYAHGIDHPGDGRFPIDRADDPFQGFVCGNVVGAFLAANLCQRVGEQSVSAPNLELNDIVHNGLLSVGRVSSDAGDPQP
ncbi:MAG: hypothetical protein A4E65_00045 [Syntrophorhabdus sp. PtaU1.Bin153]|nr:MAG: hypothetical protein A4E65_00045 [Syntrophorhabdus sp. PtaU1.Bin153]